jgi:hypothetical protein
MTTSAAAARIPAAEISGADAARYLQVGREYYAAGRIDEAIAAFRRGLAAAERNCIRISAMPACVVAISNRLPEVTRPRCGWRRI